MYVNSALEEIGIIRASCKSFIKSKKLAGWFGQVAKFDSFIFLEK